MTGYTPISTFYEDFSIADRFGADAVKDTYKRCMEAWKTDVKMLTELCMALNWKLWRWHGHNESLARVYNDIYWDCNNYAVENLKEDDLLYFYRTTD